MSFLFEETEQLRVLCLIDYLVISQVVVDALAFDLPKAVSKFAGIATIFKNKAIDIIELL
jgi:hypothetical protein